VITDTAVSITNIVGRVASFGQQALPVAQFIAGFFPGMAPVLQTITAAQPILAKIALAAPQVAGAINAGRPIIEAIEQDGPAVLPYLKQLYAIAVNHDPARPETSMEASDVSDDVATEYGSIVFTPGRSNAEQQREWDRAQGLS
jgi:hypothetical protein